jgi:hypothetical protein
MAGMVFKIHHQSSWFMAGGCQARQNDVQSLAEEMEDEVAAGSRESVVTIFIQHTVITVI